MRYPIYQCADDTTLALAWGENRPCTRCGHIPRDHATDRTCPGADADGTPVVHVPPPDGKTEIRYVEQCMPGSNHNGPAWIGRVTFSKSGRSVYYRGMRLERLKHAAVTGNHRDMNTGIDYWVTRPKKKGSNRHWAGNGPVEIDDDARAEYEAFRA